ncbi:MAG: DUF5312 family protein, partial [Spirochaetales bacterium]|nr:DUF5312 family protein [Spirochaetales bacterium]
MTENSVLHELSNSLSDKERKKLLNRINNSMKPKNIGVEYLEKASKEKEKIKFVEKELKNLGWFSKIIMTIFCKISGRSIEEAVINKKLRELKRYIIRKKNGIVVFDTRSLSTEMAEKVFEIYSYTFLIKKLYRKLWLDQKIFETACVYIVKSSYKKSKDKLYDFISLSEMVGIYGQTGEKAAIIEAAEKRVKDYVESIPEKKLAEIELSTASMTYLKDIILFPFVPFLKKFGLNPQNNSKKQF